MGLVRQSIEVPVRASEAEALWYDLNRWPSFIDGFGHLDRQEGPWPQAGATVVWSSPPGGRGRVREQVRSYEPRVGQETVVEDEKMRGLQRLTFEPGPEDVVVTLELEYELKSERPLRGVLDALFVRRPMRDSVARTLTRFRREALADRELT